jgi:ubiquinone/menaquinone biosynthesis C-methylase UbiE
MAEQGAQYDHIGSKYDEYAQTATQKRAESYTVLRMAGPLAGQRVLDLACGFGFYTRLLKQHGAAEVIGIDISPEVTTPPAKAGGFFRTKHGTLTAASCTTLETTTST